MTTSCSWTKLLASVLAFSRASGQTFAPAATPGTMAPAPVPAATMAPASASIGSTGVCTFVDTVVGVEKEEGQDRLSVRAQEGVQVAFENIVNYVRMLTIFGNARTEFYFSPPSALLDGTAASITVELSALVPTPGSGGAWTVGINNGGGNDTFPIGDLAPVSNNWTTVSITVPLTADEATGSLANYLDANGEMLVTLTSANPDSTQVVFVDYMVITASGGGSFGVTTLAPTSKGDCTFVDTVIGIEKEAMQDRLAVRAQDGVPVAFENMEYYVRMLTIFGNAQTDFYFSTPSLLMDGTAQSITVEASALVPTPGSGGVWTLSIGHGGNATAATGVFSPVGTDWTAVSTTFPVVGDAAGYVDANGEVLITVSCSEPDSTQVMFIDFMDISVSDVVGTTTSDTEAGASALAADTNEDADLQADTDAAPSVVFGNVFSVTVAAIVAASCATVVVTL
eukprot:g9669.t1